MKIRRPLLRYISTETPSADRLKAAESSCEGLPPKDAVTVLFVLAFDANPVVRLAARKAFNALSTEVMLDALEGRLDDLVIRALVSLRKGNEAVLIMAALNPGVGDETLKTLAEGGPEGLIWSLSEARGILYKRPFVLDAIKKNPVSPRFLVSELDALVSGGEGGAQDEKEAEIPPPFKNEKGDVDENNIFQLVKSLTAGQKIKLALTGNKTAREFLVKDSNKVISMSVLRNPRITEDEVARITTSKGASEDLMREVARNKEWLKNYTIRLNMVTNPKTPLMISVKLLDQLNDKDLEKLARSKNVPSVVASTARRKIEAKK